jgi:hypothetical protein
MQKDFKIGLFVGLIFVIVIVLWLATRPSLTPQARFMRSRRSPTALTTERQAEVMNISLGDAVTSQSRDSMSFTNREVAKGDTLSVIERDPEPPDLTVYERPAKIRTQRFHIVCKGDTLSAISKKYYNSPNKWQKIFNANRSQISDANKLKPGMKLIIPD